MSSTTIWKQNSNKNDQGGRALRESRGMNENRQAGRLKNCVSAVQGSGTH